MRNNFTTVHTFESSAGIWIDLLRLCNFLDDFLHHQSIVDADITIQYSLIDYPTRLATSASFPYDNYWLLNE